MQHAESKKLSQNPKLNQNQLLNHKQIYMNTLYASCNDFHPEESLFLHLLLLFLSHLLSLSLCLSLSLSLSLSFFLPSSVRLSQALARAVVDFSGRPSASVHLAFERERVGAVSTEMLTHALQSLAVAARATLHVDGACFSRRGHSC